jgi:hypothetical protein
MNLTVVPLGWCVQRACREGLRNLQAQASLLLFPCLQAFAEFASKEEALKVRLHMAIGSARKTKSQHQAVADGFKV